MTTLLPSAAGAARQPLAGARPADGAGAVSLNEYAAVVFVHGIGEQRRYESVSELLERLSLASGQEELTFKLAKMDNWPDSLPASSPVVYQEIRARRPGARGVRLFEAYWAPYTSGGTNVWSVIRWLMSQSAQPAKVRRAAWSELAQLRLGTLVELYDQEYLELEAAGATAEQLGLLTGLYQQLTEAYRQFCNIGALGGDSSNRRSHSFEQFLEFLPRYLQTSPQPNRSPTQPVAQPPHNRVPVEAKHLPRLTRLANDWHQRHIQEHWRIGLAIRIFSFSVYALIGLAVLSLQIVVMSLVIYREVFPPVIGPVQLLPHDLQSLLVSASIALGCLLLLFAWVRGPLVAYLGDVQQYVTYQETDQKYQRRKTIIAEVSSLLRQLVHDSRCTELTIVAHSLGSMIAYDALLELGRDYRTPGTDMSPLRKIRRFVTLGSPIDKIAYFFTAVQSRLPSYVELVTQLRGDLGLPPFQIHYGKEAPETHSIKWINYWDRGDLISGPIYNVVGPKFTRQRVNNQRVVNYGLPLTSRSHLGYLRHRQIAHDLYQMIFYNQDVPFSHTPPIDLVRSSQALPALNLWLVRNQRVIQWLVGGAVLALLWSLLFQMLWGLWSLTDFRSVGRILAPLTYSRSFWNGMGSLGLVIGLLLLVYWLLSRVQHLDPLGPDQQERSLLSHDD